MLPLSAIRPRSRQILATFVLACVNLAMLPCAMATADASPSEPVTLDQHCPPEHGGSGHDIEAPAVDDGHDACATAADDCCQLDSAQNSERQQKVAKYSGDALITGTPALAAARRECDATQEGRFMRRASGLISGR